MAKRRVGIVVWILDKEQGNMDGVDLIRSWILQSRQRWIVKWSETVRDDVHFGV